MFAVIKTGGKQYRVEPDDIIRIERLAGEAGADISFGEVLMVGGDGEMRVGAPLVDGVAVTGTVLEQARAKKIIVFKKKRRQNYRRTAGHRQDLTVVRIIGIEGGGIKVSGTAAKAAKKPAAKTPAAKPADADDAESKAEAADQPAAKKPAAKKPATRKTAAKKPAARKPAAKKPATKGKSQSKPKGKTGGKTGGKS